MFSITFYNFSQYLRRAIKNGDAREYKGRRESEDS